MDHLPPPLVLENTQNAFQTLESADNIIQHEKTFNDLPRDLLLMIIEKTNLKVLFKLRCVSFCFDLIRDAF